MSGIFDATQHYLQQHLSPTRYTHSLGVMRIMAELTDIYALDQKTAKLAGLAHDVAKDMSATALLRVAEQGRLPITHAIEYHPMYLHGPVGAYLAQQTLNINDPQVLTAIRTHTTHDDEPGLYNQLCWCLRFADILAPVIPWSGQEKLRRTVFAGAFKKAQLLLSTWVIEYFEYAKIPVHPNFKHNAASLLAQLQVGEEFFARE